MLPLSPHLAPDCTVQRFVGRIAAKDSTGLRSLADTSIFKTGIGLIQGSSKVHRLARSYTTEGDHNVEQPQVNCALDPFDIDWFRYGKAGDHADHATLRHSCVMWLRPLRFWLSARASAGFDACQGLNAGSSVWLASAGDIRQGKGEFRLVT